MRQIKTETEKERVRHKGRERIKLKRSDISTRGEACFQRLKELSDVI